MISHRLGLTNRRKERKTEEPVTVAETTDCLSQHAFSLSSLLLPVIKMTWLECQQPF